MRELEKVKFRHFNPISSYLFITFLCSRLKLKKSSDINNRYPSERMQHRQRIKTESKRSKTKLVLLAEERFLILV